MHSIFGSFVARPTNTRYDGEDSDETILYILRRSAITNLKWMLFAGILLVLPIIINSTFLTTTDLTDILPPKIIFLANLLWYLITFGYIFQSFVNWFFNVYIISNKKIVDMDFHGLLYKNISETPLRNVEDVTSTVSGTLQVIFNYGTVVIQTSAEKREFEFEYVSNPAKIRDLISDLVMEVKNGN
jgi:membrane protein YdbS with pleckstrin-like domain